MPTDRNPENTKHEPNHDSSQVPQNQGWDRDNESNPFVAFRRFADEQVSSVLQSITGLPSTLAPPQPDRWTIFTDDQGYKNMAYRHRDGVTNAEERKYTPAQGATESFSGDQDSTPPNNHDKTHTNGDAENTISRPRQSQSPNDDPWPTWNGRKPSDFFSLDSLFDRLEDHLLPFSPHFFHPRLRFSFPDMFEDSSSPTWPLTYIMFSPYSPLHLERQAQLRARNERGVFSSLMSSLSLEAETDPNEPQWREAFEDLLRIENGKPMVDRTSLSTRNPENGTEWLQSLVKRGSLGDGWKYVYGSKDQPWSGITFTGSHGEDHQTSFDAGTVAHNRDTNADRANEEAKSELDLYERASHAFEAQKREIAVELRERERLLNQHQRDTPPAEGDYRQGNEDTETWLDLVSGGNRKSVLETPTGSVTESTPSRVVSTISRTERVRLADGSIQTKRYQTRRYADGREETDSSVETSHASSEDAHPAEPGEKPKGGWFWKD
ncbi:uncharacterized protein N7459_008202 [Penicillium hispanicum]|uniref:uncharacterized protein n=1 Tax=Penicillium hispanicum TaxID=1080232 RepID=UPI0025426157|nr:uncharacterized protein N7459_008202 [Penicillium hispanicum]KAJ5573775.1 hypothetical protein N7459_008202 [Penicillium hispanicum]